jgi:hypothetical protein
MVGFQANGKHEAVAVNAVKVASLKSPLSSSPHHVVHDKALEMSETVEALREGRVAVSLSVERLSIGRVVAVFFLYTLYAKHAYIVKLDTGQVSQSLTTRLSKVS